MGSRLQVLGLFLKELGLLDVEEVSIIQKSVYLGQAVGVDLGYSYGWYSRGPYSDGLREDFGDYKEAVVFGDEIPPEKQLKKEFINKLQILAPYLYVPQNLTIKKSEWLELLASLDFLIRVAGESREEAEKVIKPSLSQYIKIGWETLDNIRKEIG